MYKCLDCNHISETVMNELIDNTLIDVCEKCEGEQVIEYKEEKEKECRYEGLTLEEFRGER